MAGKGTLRAVAVIAGLALVASGCSSQGGRQAEDEKGDLPRLKIALITHQAPGDTFWDIVRKGAEAAAEKSNVDLVYSNDPEAGRQASLVQNAIDQKVDGIAVTLAHPDALADVLATAGDARIPVVVLNAGMDHWSKLGAMSYFGSDESLAGETAGKRLSEDGAKHVLCVPQEQGHVALEARCDGVKRGFSGKTEKLYVTGTNMPSVRTTIAAKLKQDRDIDYVVTLGAPFALTAVQSVADAKSEAKVATFDMNQELVKALEAGDVEWAVDQQPYLQGYLAVDSLWLYNTNGNVIGGGEAVPTGPYFVDRSNIGDVVEYARKGTR